MGENVLAEKLKTVTTWMGSIILDTLFLALWILLQWGVEKLIGLFPVHSIIDLILLITLQILFSIATLVPVVLYIWGDLTIMYYQVVSRIEQEKSSINEVRGKALSGRQGVEIRDLALERAKESQE